MRSSRNVPVWRLDVYKAFDNSDLVEWPSDASERRLPPLVLFAYFSHADELPSTWRSRWGRASPRTWALEKILKTGNKPPPVPFDTDAASLQLTVDENVSSPLSSLARWRSEREFRACLWLHNIHLFRERGQTKFSMSAALHVGWTPPEASDVRHRPAFPHFSGKYSQGVGGPDEFPSKVVWRKQGAHVHLEGWFRINQLSARFANRLLFSGKGVPFMRIFVDIYVNALGPHEVSFNGSYIPTQIYQIGDACRTYDMFADIGGYHNVVKALSVGYEKPAPPRQFPITCIVS